MKPALVVLALWSLVVLELVHKQLPTVTALNVLEEHSHLLELDSDLVAQGLQLKLATVAVPQ
jgi:hypothetical protein